MVRVVIMAMVIGQGGNDLHTSLGGNDHHDHGSNDDFLIIRVMLVLIR